MPIGVPKVEFELVGDSSEESSGEWIDIYNQLYENRVLFLCNKLDDELANQLVAIMVYLDSEDESEEFYLYINSPGGSVISGIALYDGMNFIKADVNTICSGTASSMASFVLAGGAKEKRTALPNSRIMIHQPEGGNEGQASEVLLESEEVRHLRQDVAKIYAQRTGQNLNTILRDMDRDQFMSAKEAKQYGLVDNVAVDAKWSSNVNWSTNINWATNNNGSK